MSKNILLPLSLDESDVSAINTAKKLAKAAKLPIVAMHVSQDDTKASGSSYFNDLQAKLKNDGIQVHEPILVKGDVTEEILRVLEEKDIQIIIMNAVDEAHEDKNSKKAKVKLIRKTNVPVWEVNEGSSGEINRILCPIDFSDYSERALKNAIALSNLFRAELMVLSVFEPTNLTSEFIKNSDEDLKNEHKEGLDSFLKEIDFNGNHPQIKIREGKPSDEIVAEAKAYGADLLLMGSAGRSGIQRKVVGSITEKIIKALPCTVIALREQDVLNVESN